MNKPKYIPLDKFDVYLLSRKLSQSTCLIYSEMQWEIKKNIGTQIIESTDSVGANIAEGYGRYHYLDKVKFYYNARGSLLESRHWFALLEERKILKKNIKNEYLNIYKQLRPALNNLIKNTIKQKVEAKIT
jgi:four helix bundle protein